MITEFYNFDTIKDAAGCIRYVTEVLGYEVNREGRCQAKWRGGDGFNVALTRETWYDHRTEQGGGIFELWMIANNCDDIQQAQRELGKWLKLTPAMTSKKAPVTSARYDELIAAGYTEVKRYGYRDLEDNLIHLVARFEHPEKPKEFMQGTPDHWGLKDVEPILYRQIDWVHSETVAIVEGEKDVDTLIDVLGIPATTNSGGAERWRPEYNAQFQDKRVCIIRDNDEAGEAHADRVSRELKDHATEIRVVCPSKLPKGDVTDWVMQEGGNGPALIEMIKAVAPVELTELETINPLVEKAKQANRYSLCNFRIEEKRIGNEVKKVRVARPLGDIIKEVQTRFLGFPYRVGDSSVLFDHDRDTGNIIQIKKPDQLFSWMMRKSKRTITWARGDDFVTKGELLAGLIEEAHVYEVISQVPEWPKRSDVYYSYQALPEPSPTHEYLNGLCDFWLPASEADRMLIKAFFCAGLWYRPETRKPLWVVDADARGAGKSQLVSAAALVFRGEALDIDKNYLSNKSEEIMKNLLSTEGRFARYVTFDNAEGLIKSPVLAKLITQRSITGRPAFGEGMQTRPNNLNYCITSNSATLDDDLAIRAFIINLLKPKKYNPYWDTERDAYIVKYRDHITADIIDILESENTFEAETHTRFSMFEKEVLQKVCGSLETYQLVIDEIMNSRERANVDKEAAMLLEDIIRERMLQVEGIAPGQDNVFVGTQIWNKWVKWANESGEFDHKLTNQDIKNFANNGHTKFIKASPDRTRLNEFDSNGKAKQIRGVYWEANPDMKERKVIVPGFGEKRVPRVTN